MKINITNTITVREDWQQCYACVDKGAFLRQVVISIPARQPHPGSPGITGRAAVVAVPAVAATETAPARRGVPASPAIQARAAIPAVSATQEYSFILWTGKEYDEANALNGGDGYGNSDLVAAITTHLASLTI